MHTAEHISRQKKDVDAIQNVISFYADGFVLWRGSLYKTYTKQNEGRLSKKINKGLFNSLHWIFLYTLEWICLLNIIFPFIQINYKI